MRKYKLKLASHDIFVSVLLCLGFGMQSTKAETVCPAFSNSTLDSDPSIHSISPAATIQSGGIVLNISGVNLNSSVSHDLFINYTDAKTSIMYSEKGKCFSESTTPGSVICVSPNVSRITEPYFRLNNSSRQVEAIALLLVGNGCFANTTNGNPISLTVHRDPIFSKITEDHHLSEHQQRLLLLGKRIPTFINRAYFNVSLGLVSCPILEVSEHALLCNATGVIEQFKEQMNFSLNNSDHEKINLPHFDSFNNSHYIKYQVKVQIGNYQQDLGHVWVSLASPGIIAKANFSLFLLATMTAWVFLAVCALLIMTLALVHLKRRTPAKIQGRQEKMGQLMKAVFGKDQNDDVDQLNIPFERLTIGKHIGLGTFGCVYDGILDLGSGFSRKIAVKTLRDPMTTDVDQNRFLKEALIMKDFRHPNILEIIGLTEETPGVYHVILPLMENGDLLSHIRDFMVTLSVQDVYNFGCGIASGMSYLSSLKFVHRDLAARNCMLDEDHCIKIADFGLCRDIYVKGYYKTDNNVVMPLRWMALESIETGLYSTKSDVWSFGVVLWEMLTRGMTPYPCVDDMDIVRFLQDSRLAAPYFCPDSLYDLMMRCWDRDPDQRPDFEAIYQQLRQKFHTQTSIPFAPSEHLDKSYVNLSLERQTSGSAEYKNLASRGGDTGRGLEEPVVDQKTPALGVTPDVVIKYPSCMSFRHSKVMRAESFYSRLMKDRTSKNDYTSLNNARDSGL